MKIEQLHYFLTVEKYKNFSLAAEELCLSQSALSKQIKKLEIELNCLLFERCTRSVHLTEAGVTLKRHAQNMIKNYQELLIDLNEYSTTQPKLSIGYIPVINQYNLAPLIGHFKEQVNDLSLDFYEGEHNEIIDLLLNHQLDFAFLRGELLKNDEFSLTTLTSDELVLIVPKTHALSKRKYVSLSEVKNENFISLGMNSGVYQLFLNECKKQSFTPKITYLNSRIENIIALVSANMGISPLMRRVVECFDTKDITIVLLKEQIQSHLCLVHRLDKELNQLEQDFKNHLIHHTK